MPSLRRTPGDERERDRTSPIGSPAPRVRRRANLISQLRRPSKGMAWCAAANHQTPWPGWARARASRGADWRRVSAAGVSAANQRRLSRGGPTEKGGTPARPGKRGDDRPPGLVTFSSLLLLRTLSDSSLSLILSVFLDSVGFAPGLALLSPSSSSLRGFRSSGSFVIPLLGTSYRSPDHVPASLRLPS